MSTPRIRRRPDRRVPGLMVAFVLVLVGALGLWWAVTALANGADLAGVSLLDELTWGSAAVVATGAFAAVMGVVLLVIAWLPGRAAVTSMVVSGAPASRRTVITTRGLARIAEAEADRTEGTVVSRAQARPGRLRVRAGTVAPDTQEASALLTERIGSRLEDLHLRRTPRVAVRSIRKEKRS